MRLNPDGSQTDEIYDYESFMMAKKIPGVDPTFIGRDDEGVLRGLV